MEKVLSLLSLGISLTALFFAYEAYQRQVPLNNPSPKAKVRPRLMLIVRHGESQGNTREETYQTTPDPLVGLTERGKHQAIELGEKLREKIGNSPLWIYVGYITSIFTAARYRISSGI